VTFGKLHLGGNTIQLQSFFCILQWLLGHVLRSLDGNAHPNTAPTYERDEITALQWGRLPSRHRDAFRNSRDPRPHSFTLYQAREMLEVKMEFSCVLGCWRHQGRGFPAEAGCSGPAPGRWLLRSSALWL